VIAGLGDKACLMLLTKFYFSMDKSVIISSELRLVLFTLILCLLIMLLIMISLAGGKFILLANKALGVCTS